MIALVLGGASSGKSSFAESLCTALGGDLVYLATMKPFSAEGIRRVRKHQAQRAGKGFRTVECHEGLDLVVNGGTLKGATVLLECLGNYVANELFRDDGPARPQDFNEDSVQESCSENLMGWLSAVAQQCEHLVMVGNEVGCDGVTYLRETQVYQEVLGALSCKAAARSDCVVECVTGVPIILKAQNLPVNNERVSALMACGVTAEGIVAEGGQAPCDPTIGKGAVL